MTTIIASGSSTVSSSSRLTTRPRSRIATDSSDVAKTSWREEAAVVAHMADRHIVAHIMVGAAGKGKGAVGLVSGVVRSAGLAVALAVALPAAAVPAGPAVIAATMLAPM